MIFSIRIRPEKKSYLGPSELLKVDRGVFGRLSKRDHCQAMNDAAVGRRGLSVDQENRKWTGLNEPNGGSSEAPEE